jgi:PAS domain S-box-containing protein
VRIRSQINVLLVAAAFAIPLTFGVTLWSARNVEQATADINAAEDLIDSASQLRQLAVETALFHELRTQEQWRLKITSMGAEIDLMRTTKPQEESDLERIRKKLLLMQVIYPRLIRTAALSAGPVGGLLPEFDAAVESRAVASLLGVTQEVIDIGHDLIRGNRAEAAKALQLMQLSVGLVILAMAALMAVIWRLVSYRILRPLRLFAQGTKQLAAGNYAHRLALQQQDEIGELATAFDAMTVRVEQSALDLEQHRRDLAQQVRARTAELSNARDQAEALSQYARSLIEASLDPLVTISAHGKITDVNEASVLVTGVARAQLIGTDFSDYFTEPELARSSYQQVFSEGLVRDYPLAIRHTNGTVTQVLYNAAVYRDSAGAVQGVSAAARDITERQRLDRVLQANLVELHIARELAEKASLAKSDFLSSMSHELRTPLNAILGFAQLIESDTPPPSAAQRRSLEQIIKGGWYLLELINEILDLAQIESGKTLLLFEPVHLIDLVLECGAMIEPQARKRGIELRIAPLDGPGLVLVDRTRLKQVLINLLSNAVKYNRPGGAVDVNYSQTAPGSIRVSVRDTGVGLSEQQLAQLFQPFNRLGMESSEEEGTGIGLVVTKRLVEMMAGSIGAQSVAGTGSVFWIELSLATDAPPASHLLPAPPAPAHQRTLLYVEDNPDNLELVAQLVSRRGDLCLLCAAHGNLGIEFALAHLPEIILMDINLPGISGIEALKILRADPLTAHIPVIALSGNALPSDIEQGLAAGFFDYLTKPLRVAEFMQALDAALISAAGQRPAEATHDMANDLT